MELISTPENPVPRGAECTRVVTNDGYHLRAMSVRVGNARGTVVILGGRADFMERYFETARDLMEKGYCVASVDLRGQGGSQRLTEKRLRGHVGGFEEYDEDIRAFMTQVVLPDCPPPYYVLAHSTGGNIILRLIRTRNWFRKCVLIAPLVDLNYGVWPIPLVHLLTSIAMTLRLGWVYLPGKRQAPLGRKDFTGNPLTQDQRRWNRDVPCWKKPAAWLWRANLWLAFGRPQVDCHAAQNEKRERPEMSGPDRGRWPRQRGGQ